MGSLSEEGRIDTSASSPSEMHSSPSSASSSGSKFIEHNVSKLDTLAGIAIKYGVEVADIKRINGLMTDLQMFAHKSLLIPLPGRHPQSPPILSNGVNDRDWSPTRRPQRNVLDSLQSLKLKSHGSSEISPAMSSLRRYYGLQQHKNGPTVEGTEMTVYRTSDALGFKNESLPSPEPDIQSRKFGGYLSENSDLGQALLLKFVDTSDPEKSKIDKYVRRRQKADSDFLSTPENIIKDDSKGFVGRIARGLAPKAFLVSQTDADTESTRQNASPVEDQSVANLLAVRKSSSTSSLQESEYDSIWTSKWTLKPDSVTRPIFSGLPKQISSWRSKAALD